MLLAVHPRIWRYVILDQLLFISFHDQDILIEISVLKVRQVNCGCGTRVLYKDLKLSEWTVEQAEVQLWLLPWQALESCGHFCRWPPLCCVALDFICLSGYRSVINKSSAGWIWNMFENLYFVYCCFTWLMLHKCRLIWQMKQSFRFLVTDHSYIHLVDRGKPRITRKVNATEVTSPRQLSKTEFLNLIQLNIFQVIRLYQSTDKEDQRVLEIFAKYSTVQQLNFELFLKKHWIGLFSKCVWT